MISFSIIHNGVTIALKREPAAPVTGDVIVFDDAIYRVVNRGFDYRAKRKKPLEPKLQINVQKMEA